MSTYNKEASEFFEQQRKQDEEEHNKKIEICKKYYRYAYNKYVKYGYYEDSIQNYGIDSLDKIYEVALKIKKDEEEYDEDQWQKDQDKIDKEFPKCNFTISIDYDQLDEKVCDLNEIFVIKTYDCYCYDRPPYDKYPRKPDVFWVKDTKPITYRKVIEELCDKNFNPACDHRFLEIIQYYKYPNRYMLG